VTVLVDPPTWPAHGRLWSHLVSDASLTELHVFAARIGVPRQGFDRDHYDVPAEAYDAIVGAGAEPVSSRELLARLLASGLRQRRIETLGRRKPGRALLRPPRLREGSLVAVVAPAGPVPGDRLERGLAQLRDWGLRVRVGAHVTDRNPVLPHLAGADADRASDLAAAWTAPGVAAVWSARGGYGSHRIVDSLDYTAMASVGPRLVVGFSDVTAVHEAVGGRLGVASVHGPVVTSLADAPPAGQEQLRRLLFEPEGVIDLFPRARLRCLVGGASTGVLVGGNLRVLASSVGTRLSRPGRGGIVVLEDVGEQPYRIDAMLTQLLRSGWFDGVRGVVAGAFTADGSSAGAYGNAIDQGVVDAVLRDRLGRLGVPVVAGAPIGHVADNRPVPLGVPARLDADAGTVRLETPALA
jgi:muramoyltetrapeptide carboxypeptidase